MDIDRREKDLSYEPYEPYEPYEAYEAYENTERAVLLGVGADSDELSRSLEELSALAGAVFCETAAIVTQKRQAPHRQLYAGTGKIDEIRAVIDETGASLLITDDELSGAQIKNLSNALQIKVVDRTTLILDIFASRARSDEGKLQAELAQQKYRLSRLTGIGVSLSRQGGGIGTRGPGEKKLETDRRHIKRVIDTLERELKEIERHRAHIRKSREKSGIPVVSLVGYTNAGKSTVMNALTNAGVLAEDKLFATLDATTRAMSLPSGANIRLSDTVGFIAKLPHQLVKAFRATLDELRFSDLLLHVIDISRGDYKEQRAVVEGVLQKIGCADKPVINVYNKTDVLSQESGFNNRDTSKGVYISAKNGFALELLKSEIERALSADKSRVVIVLPYSDYHLQSLIRSKCDIISERHEADGAVFEVMAGGEIIGRLGKYIKRAGN